MLDLFKKFNVENQLFNPTDRILLAISGGMDSIVLADLLSKAKADFAFAHCNFCLRGDESDADQDFVKKLSKKYKVPFYSEKFETKSFAEKEKISIQMAARLLRYTWFEALMAKEGYQYLATAHHQNDVLETVILNFTRGTGISGFHGIYPKRNNIIRPLLFATREQIRDYVGENQLVWREDSSNENNKYARNLVRNEVIPLLKKLNPNLEETIEQTVEKVTMVENSFYDEVERLRSEMSKVENGNTFISAEIIASKSIIFLAEILKKFNFSYIDAKEVFNALNEQSGKTFYSPTHVLVKDRNQLVITQKDFSSLSSVEIAIEAGTVELEKLKLEMEVIPKKGTEIKNSKKLALLDVGTLKFPLKLRKWKEGDWFIPLGMNGKKKLSDFLVDEKVPVNIKSTTYVVTSGDSIVWIVGMRIDNRFKITDKTEKIYKMSIK